MNAKQILVAMSLAALSVSGMAADVDSVTIKGKSGVSRDEVKSELMRALANNEIKHGDLVALHELLAPLPAAPQEQRLAAQTSPAPGATRVASQGR